NEPQLAIIGVTGNPPPDVLELARRFSVTSMVAAPLTSGALNFGVFFTFATEPKVFDASDLALGIRLTEGMAETVAKARELDEWKQKANTDALTGVYNVRLLGEILTRQISRAERLALESGRGERRKHHVAMLALDIDDFKQVNERYGHPEGSLV